MAVESGGEKPQVFFQGVVTTISVAKTTVACSLLPQRDVCHWMGVRSGTIHFAQTQSHILEICGFGHS
jgi:hypothetical protein